MPNLFKNGFFIAIIAESMIGSSLLWDKVLLKRPGTQNVFSYVFWLGAISVFGVVLVPFGYRSLSFGLIALAFGAGVVQLAANLAYYIALKHSEASRTVALVGGFSPVATAVFGLALLSRQMSETEVIAFFLMTAGGFLMFFSEKVSLKRILPAVIAASAFFGLVNVLEKLVYDRTNFVTGYVWFTIGTFMGALALLIPPSWRRQIFSESARNNPRNRFWYFVNRFVDGLGAFLVFYAISRIHPAVVSAISAESYAIVFVGVILLTRFKPSWLHEDFSRRQLLIKILATALVVSGIVLLGLSGGSQSGGPGP